MRFYKPLRGINEASEYPVLILGLFEFLMHFSANKDKRKSCLLTKNCPSFHICSALITRRYPFSSRLPSSRHLHLLVSFSSLCSRYASEFFRSVILRKKLEKLGYSHLYLCPWSRLSSAFIWFHFHSVTAEQTCLLIAMVEIKCARIWTRSSPLGENGSYWMLSLSHYAWISWCEAESLKTWCQQASFSNSYLCGCIRP